MAWRIPFVIVLCKDIIFEEAGDNWTTGDNFLTEKRREVMESHKEVQAKV